MGAIYSILIFVSLTFIAIVIAVFVYTSSFYKAALELFASEEQESLSRRKTLITKQKDELTKKITDVHEDAFQQELRAELDKYATQLNEIDHSITKSRNKANALTVRNVVAVPVSLLLTSIVISGIATVTSGALATKMWIPSLTLIAIGLYCIFRSLVIIQSFSRITDFRTQMERALEKHEQKMRPVVDLVTWDYELEIQHGKTRVLHPAVLLKQGLTAKNVKVRFCGTEELDLPEEQTTQCDFDKKGMIKPKCFDWEMGTLNYGVYHEKPIKVKAPDATGPYNMSYWIRCDGFTSVERTFTIRVV